MITTFYFTKKHDEFERNKKKQQKFLDIPYRVFCYECIFITLYVSGWDCASLILSTDSAKIEAVNYISHTSTQSFDKGYILSFKDKFYLYF
jgi:hypothetical protein